MPRLTDVEKQDVLRYLEADKPLPDKYRFLLFDDKREVELVWNGKTNEVCNVVMPFQTIEQVDEPRIESHELSDAERSDASEPAASQRRASGEPAASQRRASGEPAAEMSAAINLNTSSRLTNAAGSFPAGRTS